MSIYTRALLGRNANAAQTLLIPSAEYLILNERFTKSYCYNLLGFEDGYLVVLGGVYISNCHM